MGYTFYIAIYAMVLALMVLATQLIARFSQVWSFCTPAIAGLGGYATAVLSTTYGWSPFSSLAAGVAGAALFGGLSGMLLARMSADFASVGSLSIQVGCVSIYTNLPSVTNGSLGIANIPGLLSSNTPEARAHESIAVLATVLLLFLVVRWRTKNTIWDWIEAAHFECPPFLSATGWPVALARAASWMLASAMAGLAGAIWVQFISFVDPNTFGSSDALLIVCIAILSGRGSMRAVGLSFGFVIFPELLRLVGTSSQASAAAVQIMLGCFVITMVATTARRQA